MSRVIHEGAPVFVPMVLTIEQAQAAFWAVQQAFMVTHSRPLAQAMHEMAVAIDKKRAELDADPVGQKERGSDE